MSGPLLDEAAVMAAFRRMDELLRMRRLRCRVYVFDGAAMLLAFPEERGSTRDVDSRYDSTSAVEAVVQQVAAEQGLPRNWLNEQARMYLPRRPDDAAVAVFDSANLTVERASLTHLLALKADAARDPDEPDIRLLAAALRLTTLEQVEQLHDSLFPDDPLTERKRAVIRRALQPAPADSPSLPLPDWPA